MNGLMVLKAMVVEEKRRIHEDEFTVFTFLLVCQFTTLAKDSRHARFFWYSSLLP